jgi:N-acetylmuramoyl-L-alanine amidase
LLKKQLRIWTIRIIGALLFGIVWFSAHAAPPIVSDARLGAHPDKTRLVLDLNQPVQYKVFTLSNPYRVVVDFPALVWRVTRAEKEQARGVISSFRYGLFQAGISRLVIDVSKPVQVTRHQILRPGPGGQYRFLIDLSPVSPAAFSAGNKLYASQGWQQYHQQQQQVALRRAPPIPPKRVPPRPRVPAKHIVMIDPGHGGPDPGAIGVRGLREKVVTMRASQAVKAALERTGKYKVFMTRDNDVYVPLRKRYQKAEDAKAELFISIHADSHRSRSVRGASVYSLSEKSSDREAAALARRENRSDIIAGIDLSSQSDTVASILIGLRQRQTMNESALFGEILISELARDIKVLRNTHRFAGFAVLKSPDIPSVLIELGYLSNPADEGKFRNSDFYNRLSGAILRSVEKYFARKTRLSRS